MEHGTRSSYAHGCRCDPCREENTRIARVHRRERYARVRSGGLVRAPHGKATTYANWGCRCVPCRAAWHLHIKAENVERKRKMLAGEMPEHIHGTKSGYTAWHCRCERCRAVVREYDREMRKKRRARVEAGTEPEHIHGTAYGYNSWGCRCDRCRAAAGRAERRRPRIGEPVNPHTYTPPEKWLLYYELLSTRTCSLGEVAEHVGTTSKLAFEVLTRMRNRGFVLRVGDNRYRAVPKKAVRELFVKAA
jgi:hypothetical protein